MALSDSISGALQYFLSKDQSLPATNGDLVNVLRLVSSLSNNVSGLTEQVTELVDNQVTAVFDNNTDPITQDGSALITVGGATVRVVSESQA